MQDTRPAGREDRPSASRWNVVVCTGPRCSARQSLVLAQALRTRLNHDGIEDRVTVREAAGLCHHRCPTGPNLFVDPGDSWYQAVAVADIDDIVKEHFKAGRPVERLLGQQPLFMRLDAKLPW